MADYVATQRFELDNQVSAGADAAAASLAKLANASDKASDATDTLSEKVTAGNRSALAAVNANDKISAAIAGVSAALRKQATDGEAIRAGLAKGTIDTEAAARANVGLADKVAIAQAKLASLRGEAQALSPAMSEAASGANSLQNALARLNETQNMVNRTTGVSGGSDYATRAADIAAYGNALDSLRAKFDPLYAVSIRYSNTLDEIQRAQAVGAISAGVAAQATERLTNAFAAANAGTSIAAEQQAALAKGMAERAAATDRAAASQAAINKVTGVSGGSDYATRAADIEAYGKSLDSLRAKYDPLYAVSKRYSDQLEEIQFAQKTGALTAGQAAVATDNVTKAYSAANMGAAAVVEGNAKVSVSHERVAFVTAGFTRELIVLGHEAITGNFSRIPGSMLVLAERTGDLNGILQKLGGFFTSVGGLATVAGVAAAAALGIMTYQAESAALAQVALSQRLRATRDDYAAMTVEIEKAAKATAKGGIVSKDDALAAGGIIGGSRGFTGSAADLQGLIRLSEDVAKSFNEGIVPAADRVAEALKAPAVAAQTLADKGFRGMTQSLVDLIKRLDESGEHAAASKLVIDALASSVGGAASAMTPLETALHDLGQAFTNSDNAGDSWGKTLGSAIVKGAAEAIEAIAGVVNALGSLRAQSGPGMAAVPRIATRTVEYPTLPNGEIAPVTGRGLNDMVGTSTMSDFIQERAAALGMSQTLANLATRIVAAESGGNQYAKNGDILTSSAGALGAGQVQQATGDRFAPGMDLTNTQQNLIASLMVIQALSKMPQFTGDTAKIAAAYNLGDAGMRSVLAGSRTLPNETIDFVRKTTGAVVDKNFNVGTQYGPPAPGTDGSPVYGFNQASMDRAIKSAGSVGSTGMSLDKLNDTLDLLKKAQELTVAGSEDWQRLQGAIEKTNGALYKTQDPIQGYIRGLQDAAAPLAAADGATRALAEAQNQLAIKAKEAGRDATAAEVYDVQTLALGKLSVGLRDNLALLDRQAAGQLKVVAGYDQSATAGSHAANVLKAEDESRKFATQGTGVYTAAVAALTSRFDEATRQAANLGLAQQNLQSKDQLEYIAHETDLVGASVEVRNRELAVLKERQKILAAPGGDIDSPEAKAALHYAERIADATTALQVQQRAISDLQQIATQAFDQVGAAIANAFAGGSKKAVDFGAVIRTVLTSVAQQIIKLAVLNPILNSVLGTNGTTLSGAIGAVGAVQGGGSTTGNVSISNLLGLGKSAYGQFGGSGGGTIGDLANTSLFSYGGGATSGGLSSVAGLQSGGANGLIAEGAISQAGTAATSTVTIGSVGTFLGGVGLGYGAGSLVGGLIAGDSPAKQQNAQIGSGVGALVGAAFGPVGSIIGGLIGGAGGGLFGPPKANHGYSWQYGQSADKKSIELSNTYVDPIAQKQFDAEKIQLANVNAFLAANDLTVGGATIVGGNNHNPNQPGSFAAAANKFSFSSSDSTVNSQIAGKNFGSFDDLQKVVLDVKAFEATLPALLDPLKKNTAGAGSLQIALDAVNVAYNNAIAKATQYGRATDDLAAAQKTATDAVRAASDKSVATAISGFQQRALAAGGPGNVLAANLMGFDTQAEAQRTAFSDQLKAIYGEAYVSTESYAAQTLSLEAALSAERLKITQQYYDQGRSQVLSAVQSLAAYSKSIALGGSSPLSSQDKYALASSTFGSTSSSALGGNFKSLQGLQGAAQDFLTASRDLNGSGAAYAADYAKVANTLSAVAGASSDALTASAMASIQQSTADQLTTALGALGANVTGATADNGGLIYAALQQSTAGLIAAGVDGTTAIIENFRTLAGAISKSAVVAIDEPALSRVMDYQTSRVVAGLDRVSTKIDTLTAEVRQQGSAPTYAMAGGNGGNGGNEH